MRIQGAFVLVNKSFIELVSHLEMGLGMLFDRGPMLGAEPSDRFLKLARFLSPSPLKEALARSTVRRLAFFIQIGFIKVVDWRVFVLVECQCVFNLGILVNVVYRRTRGLGNAPLPLQGQGHQFDSRTRLLLASPS